jgi:hypothetical protein
LLLTIVGLTLVGCGGDPTGLGASVVGTWTLQTVNGSPLPYTDVFVAGPPLHRLEFVSDTFVAADDRTYTEAFTTRETDGTTITTSTNNRTGTWIQTSGSVIITNTDGNVSTAGISGNTITIYQDPLVLVYKRQ